MALSTYFEPLDQPKVRCFAWHLDLNFGLLTIPKCDLFEVEKAMFQGFSCHFELIFGLLTIPKCDLGEDVKAMFKGLE